MEEKASFWTRLGEWLRPGGRSSRTPPDLAAVSPERYLEEADAAAENEESTPGPAEKPLSRWSRRDQALQQLQEGYQRVTELIDAMQRHMAEQSDRTERIASSLDFLARSLSDLPAASRQQAQTLDAIASHLDVTNARTQQLAESISELPGATRAQSEALTGVSRQLEMANETHVQLNHALSSLGEAVSTLRRSGEAQADSLRLLQRDSQQREDRLVDLIGQQQRRFTWLFAVTFVFAMIGAVAAVSLVVARLAAG